MQLLWKNRKQIAMSEYDHLHELAELNYVAAKEENHPEIDENGN